jgi:hypothetical protein
VKAAGILFVFFRRLVCNRWNAYPDSPGQPCLAGIAKPPRLPRLQGGRSAFSVLFGVMLGGFATVVGRVRRMAVSGVGVMRGFLVVAVIVMLGGFAMMVCRVLVVFRGAPMMLSAFVGFHNGLPVQKWLRPESLARVRNRRIADFLSER